MAIFIGSSKLLHAQVNADTMLAQKYETISDEYLRIFKLDSAIHYHEKSAIAYEIANAPEKAIEAYVQLESGSYSTYYTYYKKFAFHYLYRAKKLADIHNVPFKVRGDVYRQLYENYSAIGQTDSAFKYLKLYQQKDKSDEIRYGSIAYRRATHLLFLTQLDSAVFYYKKSLVYFEAISLTGKIVACCKRIGQSYTRMGKNDLSLKWFKKGLDIAFTHYLGTDKQFKIVDLYFGHIRLKKRQGDWYNALAMIQTAINLETDKYGRNRSMELSYFYKLLADIYLNLSEYKKALKFALKSLEMEEKITSPLSTTRALRSLTVGDIYGRLGDILKALIYYNQALEVYQNYADKRDISRTYTSIGTSYFYNQAFAKALEYFQKSLDINRESGKNPHLIAENYNQLAETYRQIGDYHKALEHVQLALNHISPNIRLSNIYQNPPLGQLPEEYLSYTCLLNKASILKLAYSTTQDINNLKMALETYQLSFQLADRIRKTRRGELAKLSVGETFDNHYDQAIACALTLNRLTKEKEGYQDQAYQFVQRSKSVVLGDAIRESDARQFGNIPAALLAQERGTREQLSFLETELAKMLQSDKNVPDSLINAKQDDIFFLKKEYEDLLFLLERDYPAYYQLSHKTEIAAITEVQQELEEHIAILDYLIGKDRLYIFTLTQTNYKVTIVPIDSSFHHNISELANSLHRASEMHAFTDRSHKLYNTLIAPVQATITGKQKLIIIPDGELFYLPFEALLSQPPVSSPRTNYSNLDYLINRYEISYHYSANLYLYSKGKESPAFAMNAGIFAPVFSKRKKNGKIKTGGSPVLGHIKKWWDEKTTRDGKQFNPLTYSETEAESILEAFKWEVQQSKIYLHTAATEEHFKQNAHRFRFLHLATHSFVNETQPKLSGIAFSQPEDTSVAEDGILYSGEIYNLDLNADLVTLSSCESGLGKLVKGEGLMAMTRGFLYAGAANVAVSLWKVSDRHTSELMSLFYQAIATKQPYAAALRQAKLKLIKNERTAFPASWSSFILIGR